MSRPLVITGARLLDPASGRDGPGAVRVEDRRIADIHWNGDPGSLSDDVEVVDGAKDILLMGAR